MHLAFLIDENTVSSTHELPWKCTHSLDEFEPSKFDCIFVEMSYYLMQSSQP